MRAEELDYDLPDAAAAQQPVEPRDAARLLVDEGPGVSPSHRIVRDLPELLAPGSLLVVNETRVRRARLLLRRPTGGAAEVLLIEPRGGASWEALVRPDRRIPPGTVLEGDGGLRVVAGVALPDRRRVVEIVAGDPEAAGHVPLPPYIKAPLDDPERYQTVFARRPGSAAAPTAGLHLTDDVLRRCEAKGVAITAVDLTVGLDTFRPLSAERVEDHTIHTEAYAVDAATWERVQATRAAGHEVVAVGTTVVRALESVAVTGELAGRSSLFIVPGHRFGAVDRLLTNFHVPRTTLLALVQAFLGSDRWRELYALALDEGYRFLSFGDAMLLRRGAPVAGS